MIRADALQIYVARDGSIVNFTIDSGGLICAFHAPSKTGGGVSVPDSAVFRIRGILGALIAEVVKTAQCRPEEVELKIAGSGVVADAIKKAAAEQKLRIKGEHLDPQNLVAYFYTDSARLRVLRHKEELKPAVKGVVAPPRKKRVLIVDDSAPVRKVLEHILGSDSDLEVVGAAASPKNVERMIEELKPDVITMDINMPEMDGLTLVQKILPKWPIPIVMISSITPEEGNMVLRALELGAVDYIEKPSFSQIDVVGPQIAERVKAAASVRVGKRAIASSRLDNSSNVDQSVIVAIGSSTGGTEALRHIFAQLPEHIPPILVVQHIPPVFSAAFARRLDELCPFEVKEAEDGDAVRPNRVLVAPGGKQMKITGRPGNYIVRINDDAPVNRHKPSVDYLFESVADCVGKNAIGVILTGMGADGAKQLLKMREAGAQTIGQDEQSCVVFGMPKEAIKAGAVECIASLEEIPSLLVRMLQKKGAA